MSEHSNNASADENVSDWISIKEACELTGRGQSTIDLWVKKKVLEVRSAANGTRLVSASAAQAAAATRARRRRNMSSDSAAAEDSQAAATGAPPSEPAKEMETPGGCLSEESTEQAAATNDKPAGLTEERADLLLIAWDKTTQVRARILPNIVAHYREMMKQDEKFPAVVLFRGNDGALFIGDGWHRLLAAKENGYHHFPAIINAGGRAAALRHALKANLEHGVRLTRADLRKKVVVALTEYPGISSNQIAETCAVSESLVRRVRATFVKDEPGKRIGADGKEYPAHKPSHPSRSQKKRKQLFKHTEKLAKQLTIEELQRLRTFIEERIHMLAVNKPQALK